MCVQIERKKLGSPERLILGQASTTLGGKESTANSDGIGATSMGRITIIRRKRMVFGGSRAQGRKDGRKMCLTSLDWAITIFCEFGIATGTKTKAVYG